ncbi:SigE family RNA polymerase sigma factor [Actinopolymorpha pittospori]|uniref:RNA polymerase sigma-70 factor (Sigma-E family) n=1 Tax=Actinopolymorpha pittospori TaxID=648752 RepID=A0A927N2X7_9ACTN|nr:RNA polymerase sigma-70 factor (sigma-E family) [Actinopolymorpha pittospori]
MDARTEAEFRQFVEARSLALLRTAYVLSGDQHHAEDLVQGALAKLAARWRKVDDPEAYVRRVVYHDQVSWWRRRGRIREELVEHAPDSEAGFATDHAGRVDRRLDVRQALARLGPRQRAVLALRYFEDLPEAEVAHILGCSVGTVRSQTARALARLRALAPELADAGSLRNHRSEVSP